MEQQNKNETKNQQHNEILSNHSHQVKTQFMQDLTSHNQQSQRRIKELKTHPHSTKLGRGFRSNFNRAHPRDATGNNGTEKLRKHFNQMIKLN